MDIDTMRKKISDVYNMPTWTARVNIMGESQVIALYYSFERRGLFDRKRPRQTNNRKSVKITDKEWETIKTGAVTQDKVNNLLKNKVQAEPENRQLTIFEFM